MSNYSVAVVGAGVVGLVSALQIARAGYRVFVISEQYSSYWNSGLWDENIILGSNIVSDVAAASFIPHSADTLRIREWVDYTSRFYAQICQHHPEAGVVLRKGKEYVSASQATIRPWYSDYVFKMHSPVSVASGLASESVADQRPSWHFETFLIEPRFFIPWLRLQLEALGVTFQQQSVDSCSELSSYDMVVNCTGVGARKLANDNSIHGIAGQVLLLQFSGFNEWFRDTSQDGHISYVYPQRNTVVVGGTKAVELSTDMEKLETSLRSNCSRFGLTELSNAPSVGLNGGYRPGRYEARVEIEATGSDTQEKATKWPIVIHNYGHGGEGYCLAPGCADYVVSLLNSIAKRSRADYDEKPLSVLQRSNTNNM